MNSVWEEGKSRFYAVCRNSFLDVEEGVADIKKEIAMNKESNWMNCGPKFIAFNTQVKKAQLTLSNAAWKSIAIITPRVLSKLQ